MERVERHAEALADKVTEYTVDGFEVYETVSYLVLRRYGERKSVPVACLGESYFFTRAEAEAVLQARDKENAWRANYKAETQRLRESLCKRLSTHAQ